MSSNGKQNSLAAGNGRDLIFAHLAGGGVLDKLTGLQPDDLVLEL
jgi:hypothetical protein